MCAACHDAGYCYCPRCCQVLGRGEMHRSRYCKPCAAAQHRERYGRVTRAEYTDRRRRQRQDRLSRIAQLRDQGYSLSDAAAALGMSRRALINVVWRARKAGVWKGYWNDER